MKVRIALATLAGVATLATVGVTTAATAASASTVTPATTAAHVYTPPGCTFGQLSARLSGPIAKGMNRSYTLTMTNTSHKVCTVSGYPGLQLLNARHQPLPTTTIKVTYPSRAKSPIVLFPGQSATATISFRVYGSSYGWYRSGPPTFGASAAYLSVTLPNSHPAWWQHYVLKIPGGPVRVVQNRLYETALMGHPYFP